MFRKWFLEKLNLEGLNRLLDGFSDKSAYSQCIFAYCENENSEPIIFVGEHQGTIVSSRGPTNFGWDSIFQPENFDKTYAELPKEIKNTCSHRSRALEKLAAFLQENQ